MLTLLQYNITFGRVFKLTILLLALVQDTLEYKKCIVKYPRIVANLCQINSRVYF